MKFVKCDNLQEALPYNMVIADNNISQSSHLFLLTGHQITVDPKLR